MDSKTHPANHGSNWNGAMPDTLRLALYLRSGLCCGACGQTVEQGAQLSLDHLRPHSRGGSDRPENLVVLCVRCNSSKQDSPLRTWLRAGGHPDLGLQAPAVEIERRLRAQARRSIDPHLVNARDILRARRSQKRAAKAA